MVVVEGTTRSTYEENMDERWNEYARAGTATHITVHSEITEDSVK